MKKIVSLLMTVIIALCANAQKDVTKFLGIPVDGSKSEMIKALKKKGFKSIAENNKMKGKFNGTDVLLEICENKNKVCRIIVYSATAYNDIADVRTRFNNLCHQFLSKDTYLYGSADYVFPEYDDIAIPQNEDIRYEMQVNGKQYAAAFYQLPAPRDSLLKDIEPLKNVSVTITNKEGDKIDIYSICKLITLYSKCLVWFTIKEYCGNYFIAMCYDNEYNRANGEDL